MAGLGGYALSGTAAATLAGIVAATGGTAAIPIGAIAIVGGVAFGLATMYQLSSGKDAPVIGGLINEQGKVFNWAAEQLEKGIGVSEQMVDAVIDGDDDMEAILKNIPDAYKASQINYETNAKNLVYNALARVSGDQPSQPGEVFRLDLGQPEPQKLPEGIRYGVDALDDARERISAGEDPQTVISEYESAFGASGYLNDFVFQSVLDPLNLAPSVGAAGMSKLADLTGNTRMIASFPMPTKTNVIVDALPMPVNMLAGAVSGGKWQGSPSIAQGMSKYQTFIRTGVMPDVPSSKPFEPVWEDAPEINNSANKAAINKVAINDDVESQIKIINSDIDSLNNAKSEVSDNIANIRKELRSNQDYLSKLNEELDKISPLESTTKYFKEFDSIEEARLYLGKNKIDLDFVDISKEDSGKYIVSLKDNLPIKNNTLIKYFSSENIEDPYIVKKNEVETTEKAITDLENELTNNIDEYKDIDKKISENNISIRKINEEAKATISNQSSIKSEPTAENKTLRTEINEEEIKNGYIPPADYSNLEKTIGKLDDTGIPKEYMPTTTPEGIGAKIKGYFNWLTELTPESKARVMQADLMDHFMRMMDNAESPQQMVEIVKAMSKVDATTTGDALGAILNPEGKSPIDISPSTFNSPIGTAFAVAIQQLADSGKLDELYLSKWQSSATRRDFLNKAAQLMDVNPSELLSRLNKDMDVASVLKIKAQEQGIEGFDNLTNEGLKDLLGIFSGKDSLPWHEDLFKLELKNVVDDSLQSFMVDRFGIKPDSKFMRIAHVMKDAQSLMLLGLNPSYLVNNTINNIVTRSAVGVFGYMSGVEIGDMLKRYGIEPYRPDAGLSKYGLASEYGIKEDGQAGKISEIKRGEYDLISKAGTKIKKLKDAVSIFSKLSGAIERSESRQAYTIAFRQMQNNLWKPGVGFSKMPSTLEIELDKISPDLKERLYSTLSGVANGKEIDAALFDANSPLRVDGLVDSISEQMAAQHSNIVGDAARYKELLVSTGIADELNKGLSTAKNIGDIDNVFDGTINKTNEHVRKMLASELETRATEIKNRVAQGGVDEAISLYADMVMGYKKEWVQHFAEIDQLQRSEYIDYETRNKQWASQNQWDQMRFDDLNNWEDATYKGIFDALGKIDDPLVAEFLDNYRQTHDNWRQFYEKKNRKWKRLFEKDYTDEQFTKVNDEISEMAASAYIQEENLQLRADDLYTQIIAGMGGDAQKASIYRTAMRVIRQEMTQLMSDFRADLVDNPPANRSERLGRWTRFIEEVYVPKIGELKRIEMVGAQQINNDPGITGKNSAGIPFMITQKMRADLKSLGFSEKDISGMTPQQAWDNLNKNNQTINSNGLSDIPRTMPTGKALSELAGDYLVPMLETLRENYKAEYTSGRKLAFDDIPDYLQPQVKQWINQVKSELPGTKLASMKYAEQMRDQALLNYSRQSGFDQAASVIFPYQFWYTHSMVNWALRMFEKPGLYALYYRYRQMQERMETEGMPQRLKGKIRIAAPFLPDWMGDGYWIDPMKQVFPFSQFMDPVDRLAQRENSIKYAAFDVLDQMVKNDEISKDQASLAKQSQEGPVWEQAYAAAANQTDFSDPMTLTSMLMSPAMYLSVPYYIATNNAEKISPTPLLRYSKSIETALSGTKLDALGKGVGLLGEPERNLREKVMTPGKAMFGEFGDYYIDRQLANMVSDGEIGLKEAEQAMIDRSGAAYNEAMTRVRNEVAIKSPEVLPLLAVKNGAKAPDVAFSLLTSLFPAGLLPSGELEVIEKQPEYTAAWEKYKLGDKEALSNFYDENPGLEARTALRDEPEERLRQFLVSEIYNRLFDEGVTSKNRSEAISQLGQNFQDSFLNKETKDTDSVSIEQLAQWSNQLGGLVPQTTTYEQAQPVSMWPENVAQAYQTYQDERDQLFPNYYAIQDEYYSLPKSQRGAFLKRFPELKQYWEWKAQYQQEHPEIAPILASNAQDAEMQNSTTGVDITQMDPDLANQIQYSIYTGNDLTPGAWMALEYQWEKSGKPYGDFKTWVDNEILVYTK